VFCNADVHKRSCYSKGMENIRKGALGGNLLLVNERTATSMSASTFASLGNDSVASSSTAMPEDTDGGDASVAEKESEHE
jgi:hypothetical protein